MSNDKRKFSIHATYTCNGTAWPVSVEIEAPAKKNSELQENLTRVLTWLMANGFRPAQTSGVPVTNLCPGGQTTSPPMTEAEAMSNSIIEGKPLCPIHGEEMKRSGTQKKPGQVAYFCTKQEADGYCKHRGAVDLQGKLSLWKVS